MKVSPGYQDLILILSTNPAPDLGTGESIQTEKNNHLRHKIILAGNLENEVECNGILPNE